MRKFIILILAVLLSAGAYAADIASGSPPLTKKEQRRTLRGYKGFVEVASLTSFEVFGDDYLLGEFTTSHGYQANNFFYLGGGTGVHIYSQYGALVPFFANLRINIRRTFLRYIFQRDNRSEVFSRRQKSSLCLRRIIIHTNG